MDPSVIAYAVANDVVKLGCGFLVVGIVLGAIAAAIVAWIW